MSKPSSFPLALLVGLLILPWITSVATALPRPTAVECIKEISTDGVSYTSFAEVYPGQVVFFKITVNNLSDGSLERLEISDPAGDFLYAISIVQGQCELTPEFGVFCEYTGPITPGETVEVIYAALVANDAVAGVYMNEAMAVGFINGTIDITNCSVEYQILDLSVECVKEVSMDGVSYSDMIEASPGDELYFRVTVTNTSGDPVTFQDVEIFDELYGICDPQLVSGNCPTVEPDLLVCRTGPLPPLSTYQVVYTATVCGPPGETVFNQAFLFAYIDDDAVAFHNCTATVQIFEAIVVCQKLVSLNGMDWFDSVEAYCGQEVYFKVVAVNESPGNVTFDEIRLEDVLDPTQFANPIIFSPVPECGFAGNTLECSFPGPLPPFDIQILDFKAEVVAPAGMTVVNAAQVWAIFDGVEVDTSICEASVAVVERPSLQPFGGPGSVLIYPYVNTFPDRTLITITNTNGSHEYCGDGLPEIYEGSVRVKLIFMYIEDAPGGEDCVQDDKWLTLTPNDTISFFADDLFEEEREGWVIAVAVSMHEQEMIDFDHLIGNTLVYVPDEGAFWSYDAYTFRALGLDNERGYDLCGHHLADINNDQTIQFDNEEYDAFPLLQIIPQIFQEGDGGGTHPEFTNLLGVMSTETSNNNPWRVKTLLWNNSEDWSSDEFDITCFRAGALVEEFEIDDASSVVGALLHGVPESNEIQYSGWMLMWLNAHWDNINTPGILSVFAQAKASGSGPLFEHGANNWRAWMLAERMMPRATQFYMNLDN